MKIGIVGGGISGISAAYHLHGTHDVTLLESSPKIGGHTNTITVPDNSGEKFNIDTGFIVFNDRNYPYFSNFLADLKVPMMKTDMSFSYTNPSNSVGYAGTGPGLFPNMKSLISPIHIKRLWNIYKYSKLLNNQSNALRNSGRSITAILKDHGCPDDVTNSYFSPIASAIWSCSEKDAKKIPAGAFINFFQNHGLLSFKGRPNWFTITNGGQNYLKRFKTFFNGTIHENSEVASVKEDSQGVDVYFQDKSIMRFDTVIMATHADISAKIYSESSDKNLAILRQYLYSHNAVVLHKDVTYMPKNKKIWASWNVRSQGQNPEESSFEVTYNMNRLQRLKSQTNFLVTLNPIELPENEMILYSTYYRHPILSLDKTANERNFSALNSQGRVYFCGSYLGYGFHEDGFASGMKVANLIKSTSG